MEIWDYNGTMRYYTTERSKEGTILLMCRHCEYQVTTQGFDPLKGNCQTQAAAALNQHAATHYQFVAGDGPWGLWSRRF